MLHGRLLADDPAVVARWIERLAAERKVRALDRVAERSLDYGADASVGVADYDLVDPARFPAVRGPELPAPAQKLARLKSVAELLADRLAWDESEATHLILQAGVDQQQHQDAGQGSEYVADAHDRRVYPAADVA